MTSSADSAIDEPQMYLTGVFVWAVGDDHLDEWSALLAPGGSKRNDRSCFSNAWNWYRGLAGQIR